MNAFYKKMGFYGFSFFTFSECVIASKLIFTLTIDYLTPVLIWRGSWPNLIHGMESCHDKPCNPVEHLNIINVKI